MKKVLAEIEALERKLAVDYQTYMKEHPGTQKMPSDPMFSDTKGKIDWKKEREKFEESKKPQKSKKTEPDLSQYDPKIRPGIEKMQQQVKKHDERNPFSPHYKK